MWGSKQVLKKKLHTEQRYDQAVPPLPPLSAAVCASSCSAADLEPEVALEEELEEDDDELGDELEAALDEEELEEDKLAVPRVTLRTGEANAREVGVTREVDAGQANKQEKLGTQEGMQREDGGHTLKRACVLADELFSGTSMAGKN